MEYIAIEEFTDLQDNNHKYLAGDEYPHKGLVVSNARIVELSTNENRRHRPMIKAVSADEPKTPVVEDTKEVVSELQEEPIRIETGSHSSKTTKTKKSKEKAQKNT